MPTLIRRPQFATLNPDSTAEAFRGVPPHSNLSNLSHSQQVDGALSGLRAPPLPGVRTIINSGTFAAPSQGGQYPALPGVDGMLAGEPPLMHGDPCFTLPQAQRAFVAQDRRAIAPVSAGTVGVPATRTTADQQAPSVHKPQEIWTYKQGKRILTDEARAYILRRAAERASLRQIGNELDKLAYTTYATSSSGRSFPRSGSPE